MHAFRSYIFAVRIACDSGPTCCHCAVSDMFCYRCWWYEQLHTICRPVHCILGLSVLMLWC